MTLPNPPLREPAASQETIDALQRVPADLIDLSLQVKVAHWTVQCPHFRSVHLAFDDIVTIAREEFDVAA